MCSCFEYNSCFRIEEKEEMWIGPEFGPRYFLFLIKNVFEVNGAEFGIEKNQVLEMECEFITWFFIFIMGFIDQLS